MEKEKERPAAALGGRISQVKNKQPAPVQITAEQILRGAFERQEPEPKPLREKIMDHNELEEYKYRKRKEFEDRVRIVRNHVPIWIRYAVWEEGQKEFDRARSIFERAVDIDYRSQNLWVRYAEFEMRNKFINRARNVWDRAVSLLPRIDQLWLKYSYMEEMLGNIQGARDIFERWMKWEPEEIAWNAFIKFELRCQEYGNVRNIHERLVQCHPTVSTWLKYARFEERYGTTELSRNVHERALEALGEGVVDERLYIAFAKFEEKMKEIERARAIYKYALDHVTKEKAKEIYSMFAKLEKQYGDRDGIDDVILGKKRFQYEEELKEEPSSYDTWFDYIRLEERHSDIERVREIYERAIANIPPVKDKSHWRRYVYLWISYATFEELEAEDMEMTREVFKAFLNLIPHKVFTFSKAWILFAHFEVRQGNLSAARKILGHSIGMCPRNKLFDAYIDLEQQLGNVDRCRLLYQKYLEHNPSSCSAWQKYCDLESDLGESERARALYELGTLQPELDFPEVLWKSYIDFEIELDELDNARALYERLLERTKHVKVWIGFARFEAKADEIQRARSLYERASEGMRGDHNLAPDRAQLFESWRDFEKNLGDKESLENLMKKMPKRIRKRKPVKDDEGNTIAWEEYFDYMFPDDERGRKGGLKILEAAQRWKKQRLTDNK